MVNVKDGPGSSLFSPLSLNGNVPLTELTGAGISNPMSLALEHAPNGDCVSWGIPLWGWSQTRVARRV